MLYHFKFTISLKNITKWKSGNLVRFLVLMLAIKNFNFNLTRFNLKSLYFVTSSWLHFWGEMEGIISCLLFWNHNLPNMKMRKLFTQTNSNLIFWFISSQSFILVTFNLNIVLKESLFRISWKLISTSLRFIRNDQDRKPFLSNLWLNLLTNIYKWSTMTSVVASIFSHLLIQ